MYEKLIKNMKGLRKKARMSQTEVAMECGATQNMIWKYEPGKSIPSLDVLLWYSERFGVTLDELVGRADAKASKNQAFSRHVLGQIKLTFEQPKSMTFCSFRGSRETSCTAK